MILFHKAADSFSEALPVGNGKLGAMIYGGTETETVLLNQDSIWYGAPVDRINPDARGNLEKVRSLILSGNITEAEDLLRCAFSGTPQSQRPYQMLANVEITYRNMGKKVSDYHRILNLEEGMVEECFTYREGTEQYQMRKEYLASFPMGILVIHMKASGPWISFETLLRRKRFYENAGKLDEAAIYIDGTLGEGGVKFLLGMGAQTDGEVSVLGEHLLVKNASEVTLYISCETSFYSDYFRGELAKKLAAARDKEYGEIRKQHVEDYRKLYDRVSFRLAGEENIYAQEYFQFGRYLMISGSRPGSLPLNLQGIWNDSMSPPWDAKYTININTQMNYWPAEICNLSECHLPLFEHLKRMVPKGSEVAERMYGCRGFVAHHNTDIWGDCAPQDIYVPATYWVMGAAWLCTHIWNHYLYTLDGDFLKEMYPTIKESVLFFHDFLIEDQGEMVTCPSVSPENTYIMGNGGKGCICAGAAMDNQILRDLLEGFLKASKALNIRDEMVERSVWMLNRISPIRIGKYGQIMEWREDYEEEEPGHRHISQLYGLHPAHQITVDKTPELAGAALRTLERRLTYGGGHTGWSCAWIVNLYARLSNGEKALENLEKLWKNSTFPNRMCNHPLGDGYAFQIDGNLGAIAAISEMLVQADEDKILLLPALPSKWAAGCVRGLRLPHNAEISISWKNHRAVYCALEAYQDYRGKLYYQGKCHEIMIKRGQTFIVEV